MDDNARLGNLLDDYGRAFHAAMTGNGGNGTQERADSARKLLADFALRSVPAQGMVMVPRELPEISKKMAEAVRWILHDAAFKAPEQIGDIAERWVDRLQAVEAFAAQALSAAEEGINPRTGMPWKLKPRPQKGST